MSRKLISRERIIEAALFSAFKKGMGATSLADIAEFLGIKKASLYNHFESKEEMLKAVYIFCSDFYAQISFISDEILSKLDKANAVKLFKSSVSDFIKKHESEPLFQIYTLVSSEKYFTKECLDIFQKQKSKIENQVFLFYKLAADKAKFNDNELKKISDSFCGTMLFMMDNYLSLKKEKIRQNPECDAGSLFALPSDDKGISAITKFAEENIQQIL